MNLSNKYLIFSNRKKLSYGSLKSSNMN